jgi:hypothetical protein
MYEGTVLHTLMLRKGAELSVFDVKDFLTAEAYMHAFGARRPVFLGCTLVTFLHVEVEPPYSVVPAVPGRSNAGDWRAALVPCGRALAAWSGNR